MPKISCPRGYIEKSGFKRKAYYRRQGNSKSNKKIYIPSRTIKSTCIKDQGKPGKGPKTLPPLRGDLSLRAYGYSIHKPASARHSALREAAKDNDVLKVLRHLNLIRNKQAESANKDKFSSDMEYMSKIYKRHKRQSGRQSGRQSQSGGDFAEGTNQWYVDEMMNVGVGGDISLEIDQTKEKCINNKCSIYERHIVNGNELIYLTLGKDELKELPLLEESDEPMINTSNTTKLGSDRPIGIKSNGVLKGYFIYTDTEENRQVTINKFVALRGFASSLYAFLEIFFERNGITKITIPIDTSKKHHIMSINFFTKMDFTIETIGKEIVFMEKYI